MSVRWMSIGLVSGILVAACSPAPAATPTSTIAPKPAAPTAASVSVPSPPASPVAVASPSPLRLGSLVYNDRGTNSVVGQASLDMAADDYTFNPTFLRGSPSQNLTLRIANKGEEEHNFSVSAQQVDKDVAPAASVDVAVTFPSSGVLRFFCKYHASVGMNGQLLAGDATPQPAQ